MKNPKDLLASLSPCSSEFTSLITGSVEGLKRYYVIVTALDTGLFEYTIMPKTAKAIAEVEAMKKELMNLRSKNITTISAQELKKNLYSQIKWEPVELTELSTQVRNMGYKGVANQVMKELEKMYPEIKSRNKSYGAYKDLKYAIDKATGRLGNLEDPFGIKLPSKVLFTHSPIASIVNYIVTEPVVQSKLAFYLKGVRDTNVAKRASRMAAASKGMGPPAPPQQPPPQAQIGLNRGFSTKPYPAEVVPPQPQPPVNMLPGRTMEAERPVSALLDYNPPKTKPIELPNPQKALPETTSMIAGQKGGVFDPAKPVSPKEMTAKEIGKSKQKINRMKGEKLYDITSLPQMIQDQYKRFKASNRAKQVDMAFGEMEHAARRNDMRAYNFWAKQADVLNEWKNPYQKKIVQEVRKSGVKTVAKKYGVKVSVVAGAIYGLKKALDRFQDDDKNPDILQRQAKVMKNEEQ